MWGFITGIAVVLDVKDTVSWLQGVKDDFVERRAGYYLGGLSAALSFVGLAIVLVGIARAL